MARIGRMIATLHGIELPEGMLRVGPSPLQMLSHAKAEAHDITQFLPELESEAERTKMALMRLAPGPEFSLPRTTIHGTFKLAQILVRDDRLAIVDFDSVAYGDPVYDLAEFVASVAYLEVRDGVSRQRIEEGIEQFLAGYDSQMLVQSNRQRLAWYVVIFLMGKIHASLKGGDAGEVEHINSSLDLICHWLQRADE
jgi:aminoglycoside phosphotransferase (APT) family kinase protein